MAFNGTENFERNELVDYFETIGMSFGPEINAYTSFDETVYKLEIPVVNPQIVRTLPHQRVVDFYKRWYKPQVTIAQQYTYIPTFSPEVESVTIW